MTKEYIGTKIVRAYLSIKDSQEGYAVIYDDGYSSWSPKDVFERHYREVTPAEVSLIINGGGK